MTALMRGRDLTGLPVVTLSTGEDIAEVRDLIFDPVRGQITGLTLRKRGLFGGKLKELLAVEQIHAIGSDAVMIESSDSIADPAEAPATVADAVANPADVADDMVVTESGKDLGRVRDVVLVGGSRPRVVGFQIGGGAVGDGFIPINPDTATSANVLIVPDDFERRVRTEHLELSGDLADLDATAIESGLDDGGPR